MAQNPTVVVVEGTHGHSLLVRALWFVFFGFWLGGIVSVLGWLFLLLIVTIPVGIAMLNALPRIATLREPKKEWRTRIADGTTVIERAVAAMQHPFWLRAVWFVFVGWWLIAVVLTVAYACIIIPFFWPLAFLLYDRIPLILTLRR